MKTIKTILLLAFIIFISKYSSAQSVKVVTNNPAVVTDDTQLKLKLNKEDWKINVQVSFNGNEGNKGKLKVYNSSKELVTEFDIELKKSPEYYSVNLDEFANDTYTFELTTGSGVHTSYLIIK